MAVFKLIPLLCSHVYSYMFSIVHPQGFFVFFVFACIQLNYIYGHRVLHTRQNSTLKLKVDNNVVLLYLGSEEVLCLRWCNPFLISKHKSYNSRGLG